MCVVVIWKVRIILDDKVEMFKVGLYKKYIFDIVLMENGDIFIENFCSLMFCLGVVMFLYIFCCLLLVFE